MATPDDKNHVLPKACPAADRSGQPEFFVPAADDTPSQAHGFKPRLVVIPPAPKAKPTVAPPKLHLEHKKPGPTQQASVIKPRILVLPTRAPPKEASGAPPAPLVAIQPLHPSTHEPRPATPALHLIPLAELKRARSSPTTPVFPPAADTPRVTLQPSRRRSRTTASRSGRRWLLTVPVVAAAAAFFGWWAFDRARARAVPPPPATRLAPPAVFSAPLPLVARPERPVPTGGLQVRVFAIAADGARHAITNKAIFALRHTRTPLTLTTNAVFPFVWRNLVADTYVLSVTALGYRPISNTDVTVAAQEDVPVSLDLHPLPTSVRFVPSASDVTFAVYQDGRYLGSSKETFALDPFVPQVLTFKASGWREATVKVTLASPGIAYRCRVAVARIAAGMEITVVSDRGELPKTGLISINDSDPVLVVLPLKRTALPYAGEVKIALTIGGYKVLNPARQVLLADGQTTHVVFRVEPNE